MPRADESVDDRPSALHSLKDAVAASALMAVGIEKLRLNEPWPEIIAAVEER